MIISGKLDRVATLKTDALVSFIIPAYQANYLSELVEEEEYKIEVTKIKSKRSLQQNRLMWSMIGKIAKHEGVEQNEIYCQLIEMAHIDTIFLEGLPNAQEKMKKKKNVFRVMVERDQRKSSKGVDIICYECYFGTSTFDQAEMSEFIDRMLDYAEKIGINTMEYER